MCKPKPYPRCSNHARKRLESALASGNEDRIRQAKAEYAITPEYIEKMRKAGKSELLSKLKAKRYALLSRADWIMRQTEGHRKGRVTLPTFAPGGGKPIVEGCED